MRYEEVLTYGWKLLKRQKALWLFGLLAALGGVQAHGMIQLPSFKGNQFHFPWSPMRSLPNRANFMPVPTPFGAMPHTPPMPPGHSPSSFFLLMLALCGVGLLLLIVVSLAIQGITLPAIIRGAYEDYRSGGAPLTVSALYQYAKPYFWRVIGLIVFIGVIVMVGGIILGIVIVPITLAGKGVALFCLFPLFGLIFLVVALLAPFVELSLLALILEDLSVFDAFSRGWELYKRHFWRWILVTLLLSAVAILVRIIVTWPFILVGIAGGVAGLFYLAQGGLSPMALWGAGIGLSVLVIIALVVLWLVNSALVIYAQGGWVAAYIQTLAEEQEESAAASPAAA